MKNRRALLLSCFMLRGYGVSVVADQLQRHLASFGWDLHIGFLESDAFLAGQNRLYMPADSSEIVAYCLREKIEIVIAQTSPYFEVLPELAADFPTVCFEHGDPTPEFFRQEQAMRAAVKHNKVQSVYPRVSEVWTISEFLRHELGWPPVRVIPNGANHTRVRPVSKTSRGGKVRVGFLSRLGELEAEYKGNDLLIALADRFSGDQEVEFVVMGRGVEADAESFRVRGISVALNATDDERDRFFQEVDVFFSASRWEGFNLPLVEAQHAGCAAIAFDVGAHPETTPYLVGSLDEAETLLRYWISDPFALEAAARRCQQFVDDRFTWERSAELFAQGLEEVVARHGSRRGILWRVSTVLRRHGVVGTAKKVLRRVVSR